MLRALGALGATLLLTLFLMGSTDSIQQQNALGGVAWAEIELIVVYVVPATRRSAERWLPKALAVLVNLICRLLEICLLFLLVITTLASIVNSIEAEIARYTIPAHCVLLLISAWQWWLEGKTRQLEAALLEGHREETRQASQGVDEISLVTRHRSRDLKTENSRVTSLTRAPPTSCKIAAAGRQTDPLVDQSSILIKDTSRNPTTAVLDPSAISMKSLVDELGEEKGTFLYSVQNKVREYVMSTGKNCVAVIEKKPETCDELHKTAVDEFIPVFACFLMKRRYFGHEIGSALTEPIIHIVSQCYMEFLRSHSQAVEAYFMEQILSREVVRQAFLDYVANECIKHGIKASRSLICHQLRAALHSFIHCHAAQLVAHQTSATITTVSTTSVGQTLGKILLKIIAKNTHYIAAKCFSHTALTSIIKPILHKYLWATIGGIVIQTSVQKLGISKASAIVHGLLIKLLFMFIIYKIKTMPRTMGEKLGQGVRDVLEDKFTPMTEGVLQDFRDKMFAPDGLVKDVALDLVKTAGWQHMVEGAVGGFDAPLKGYPELEKDFQKIVGRTAKLIKMIEEDA